MKFILPFLLSLVLFASCEPDNDSKQEQEIQAEEKADSLEETTYTDTVLSFTDVHEFEFSGPKSTDETITIDGKKYRLHLECELLKNQRLSDTEKFGSDGTLHINTYVGYQAKYRFTLFQGEKIIFDHTLKKEDFKESIYSLVLESDAYLPELVTYNAAFKSLVFYVPFYIEGSCWATNALLVLDMNSKVKFVDELSTPMGNSRNRDVQFSPSKKHMISYSAIHHADGKHVKLGNKSTSIMGTNVFSDCILAVYEYEKGKHDKNAYLLDYEGKTLLNFRYEGWTGALGYHFPFKKVHGNYYYIDETNKRLIQLKKGKTWSYKYFPFSGMKEFDGMLKSGEIAFFFQTETQRYHYFLDVRSMKIRKITPKEL